eukprot:365823-Chlamydomonas_euryale.AAC.2
MRAQTHAHTLACAHACTRLVPDHPKTLTPPALNPSPRLPHPRQWRDRRCVLEVQNHLPHALLPRRRARVLVQRLSKLGRLSERLRVVAAHRLRAHAAEQAGSRQ